MIEDYFQSGIKIERETETRKSTGAVTTGWATHLTVSGRIRPLSGQERLSANKETLYATHRMYTAVADITEKDRVNDDGDIYRIVFVSNPMNMDRFLQIDLELVS